MAHTFFENHRVTAIISTAGTVINTTVDGTAAGTISIADYEYHALCYVGTIANTGTFFAYAVGASQTPFLLGSFIFGSINQAGFVWEFKSDAVGAAAGTLYTGLGATLKVDASGTVRGVAQWVSSWPRSAGTTPLALGWGSVGTTLT